MIGSISQNRAFSNVSYSQSSKNTVSSQNDVEKAGQRPPPGGPPPAGAMPPPNAATAKTQSLTDTQMETLESILSEYDSTSLTEEDAQAISESLSEAGLNPSSSLKDAMSEFGFDAEEIKQLNPNSEQNSFNFDGMKMREMMGTFKQMGSERTGSTVDTNQSINTQQMISSLLEMYQSNQNYSYSNDSSDSYSITA